MSGFQIKKIGVALLIFLPLIFASTNLFARGGGGHGGAREAGHGNMGHHNMEHHGNMGHQENWHQGNFNHQHLNHANWNHGNWDHNVYGSWGTAAYPTYYPPATNYNSYNYYPTNSSSIPSTNPQ